ncbi:Transmembrane protein 42 [Frankliniella fusca]|uniref:Transmembrane protein 42 n=1 Tax=Frankliniella fusca TaxID=407009 RepID=A0AAE1HEN7_9NEOP|nr:Transmembrane protein 42 [Frankliniella fusca]
MKEFMAGYASIKKLSVSYSVLSGVSAASASVFGKLYSEAGSPLLGVALIFLMILSNSFVWTMFVKALRDSESSLTVTVTSAAVNYCFSAVFGWLLFSEHIGALWWLGTFLVISGVLLINSASTSSNIENIKQH